MGICSTGWNTERPQGAAGVLVTMNWGSPGARPNVKLRRLLTVPGFIPHNGLMTTYEFTRCESCGDVFTSATMTNLDTSPECGICYNERLAPYITARWTPAMEPSEPDTHADTEMTPDGLVCNACNAVIYDMATLREDYELEQAEIERDYELYG